MSTNERKKTGPQPIRIEDRFWPKVAIGSPDECWLWQACTYSHGYGKFALTRCNPVYAHRLAYELTHGAIPDGLCVLHRCDVRACCNPKHLFLGTQLDNIADMHTKGRHVYRSKLTPEQVIAIRQRYSSGDILMEQLASEYGISISHISVIINHKAWRHLP